MSGVDVEVHTGDMGDGLSDAQRRRMARERERAERRMAVERERIQPLLAAERQRIALDARHRDRFGPKVVTGPDGVRVHLEVSTTGTANWQDPPPSLRGPYGTHTDRRTRISAYRLLFARSGFELWISAEGVLWRDHHYFARDEKTAAALLLGAAQEIEEGGLPALRAWAQRRQAEGRWR